MSECLFPHSFCQAASYAALREERIEGLPSFSARTPVGLTAGFACRQLWSAKMACLHGPAGHVFPRQP
ncbi:hypothetical protein AmDm5_0806 [Acetobacter malorum]|nr:hypothetical protein AmDm5_0806 [Acetobacter malorum]